MLVDLDLPEEELLARLKGNTRYNIRLADRKGVEVVEPDFEEARETFYGFMKDTADRTGYPIRRSQEYLYDNMREMHDAGRGNPVLCRARGDSARRHLRLHLRQ
jgi:lipid II:glycine glycyltransferase (peptidoglycan interpeptide bridge formation enzyme)